MTPPRGRLVEVAATFHRHAREMLVALGLAPMVRHQVRPVLQPRNLDAREVAHRLPLLDPQGLNVEVLHLPDAGPLHDAPRRGRVCGEPHRDAEVHLVTHVGDGHTLGGGFAQRVQLRLGRTQRYDLLSPTPMG